MAAKKTQASPKECEILGSIHVSFGTASNFILDLSPSTWTLSCLSL